MKILVCFGTRPETIKMAPIYHELKKHQVDIKVCVTAQHREMLDQALKFFKIKPDFDLDLMKSKQSLNSLSSSVLHHFDNVLEAEQPDLVLVQGDTTTAFISALAAFNKEIKIGHIEAGLRTYNKKAPFPEEGNRQLISRIADFHFVPTVKAKQNLLEEGIPESSILLTGNTIVDALEWTRERFTGGFEDEGVNAVKEQMNPQKMLILVTGHRRENFGAGLEEICEALLQISQKDDVQIIFPVHMNPKVKNIVYQKLASRENIMLTDPLDYPVFLWLLQTCTLVISDSGGIQEEAPSFGKQVLVTREVSERMEGVEAGFSFLVGTAKSKIVGKALEILDNPQKDAIKSNPYGDGRAALRIVKFLLAKGTKNS